MTRAPARPSSPPWYGGLAIALAWLFILVLISYTLVDIPWQQALGGWNYAIAGGFLLAAAVALRRWRPDQRR